MKKLIKLFIILILLIPPGVLCIYWYKIEYEVVQPFSNFEVRGWNKISPKTVGEIYDLANNWYKSTENKFPIQFNKKESTSYFSDFDLKLSESITEKLGIFSFLPYHQVCLVNKNKIYINGEIDNMQSPYVGAVTINQEGGYNFYAQRGGRDCKLILVSKFRKASSSPELGYLIAIDISPDENIKRLNGEKYVVNLATTSVEAMNTQIIVSLHWWAVILVYLLLLFAWSFVFFQYKKIVKFIFQVLSK